MSNYPTRVWEAANRNTYKTEAEAIEASKRYFTRQFMLELLDTNIKTGSRFSGPNDDLNRAVHWFVANPETILAAFKEAKEHAEEQVVKGNSDVVY